MGATFSRSGFWPPRSTASTILYPVSRAPDENRDATTLYFSWKRFFKNSNRVLISIYFFFLWNCMVSRTSSQLLALSWDIYHIYSVPWLQVSWQWEELGHQQPRNISTFLLEYSIPATEGLILKDFFPYSQCVYKCSLAYTHFAWRLILRENHHASVVWNWYHWVAIAYLYQPSP